MSEIDKKTRADLFRKRIEDKNTLTGAGAIYVGTGIFKYITSDGTITGSSAGDGTTGPFYETIGIAPTTAGQIPVSVAGETVATTGIITGLEFKSVNDAMKNRSGNINLDAKGFNLTTTGTIDIESNTCSIRGPVFNVQGNKINLMVPDVAFINDATGTQLRNVREVIFTKSPYTAPSGTPDPSGTPYAIGTDIYGLTPIISNISARLDGLGFKETSILTRGVDVVVKGDSTATADFRQGFVIEPSAGKLSYTVRLTDLYDTPLIGTTLNHASFNPELDVFIYKNTNYSFTQCSFYDLHQNGSFWELRSKLTDGVEISKVQPSSDFKSLTFNFAKIPSDAFYITFPVEHEEHSGGHTIEKYFTYNRKYYLADITKYGNVWTLDFYNTARTYLDSTTQPDATEENPYEVVLNNWPPMKTFDGKIITGIYKTLGCGNNGVLYDCGVHYKYQNGETPELLFTGTGTVFTRIRGTNALITS